MWLRSGHKKSSPSRPHLPSPKPLPLPFSLMPPRNPQIFPCQRCFLPMMSSQQQCQLVLSTMAPPRWGRLVCHPLRWYAYDGTSKDGTACTPSIKGSLCFSTVNTPPWWDPHQERCLFERTKNKCRFVFMWFFAFLLPQLKETVLTAASSRFPFQLAP